MAADTTLEKPLPNNLDAERSVLGAILLDNHALNPAIEHLRPEDFFLDQHRRVFTQMIALGESQQAIDLVTLTEEMHRKGDLEASGGAPYLASLADGMPKVSNIEHYARIVKEKAILRNLIHATHHIQQRAFEGEDGADTILDNAESSIFALAEDRVKAGLVPIKEIVRDNFERLEKIFREGKSITGIATGYTELDKLTSGLQPSELLILAARPALERRPWIRVEAFVLAVALVAVTTIAFSSRVSFTYLVIVIVLWIELRFQQPGTAVAG